MAGVTDQIRNGVKRVLSGPAGGMLSCLLLAALLGGVAAANPGARPSENASQNAQAQVASEPEAEDTDGNGATSGEHTAADCAAAVEGSELPDEEEATGLSHAIYVLSGNCEKNLQAPGLLVALDRLVRNLERHEAHQTAKEEGLHGNSASAPGQTGEAPGHPDDPAGEAAGPNA
jgi:hypothetical protein